MSKRLSRETIMQLRQEVLSGKSNYQVAKESGISETTVRNHQKILLDLRILDPVLRKKKFLSCLLGGSIS